MPSQQGRFVAGLQGPGRRDGGGLLRRQPGTGDAGEDAESNV